MAGARELASAFGLRPERAQAIVREVLAATHRWQRVAAANGCPEREATLFRPVFDDRASALASAFGL